MRQTAKVVRPRDLSTQSGKMFLNIGIGLPAILEYSGQLYAHVRYSGWTQTFASQWFLRFLQLLVISQTRLREAQRAAGAADEASVPACNLKNITK